MITGKIERGWEKAEIVSIFEGEFGNETEKYRGVSLLDTGYKILEGIKKGREKETKERRGSIIGGFYRPEKSIQYSRQGIVIYKT